jgi:hypothetical protein
MNHFKKGDIVRSKTTGIKYKVEEIKDNKYIIKFGKNEFGGYSFSNAEDRFSLVPKVNFRKKGNKMNRFKKGDIVEALETCSNAGKYIRKGNHYEVLDVIDNMVILKLGAGMWYPFRFILVPPTPTPSDPQIPSHINLLFKEYQRLADDCNTDKYIGILHALDILGYAVRAKTITKLVVVPK